MNSKKRYFSTYQSPNIVIDTNKTLVCSPIVKKKKIECRRVNTNLRILHDNQKLNVFREMDSSLVKLEKDVNINKPIKKESPINETVLCNNVNKSKTISMDDSIPTKINLTENYKSDNSQAKNVMSQVNSGIIKNSNTLSTKNITLKCEEQVAQENTFNNSCLLSTIKTEPYDATDNIMTTSSKNANFSNVLPPKLAKSEDNKITHKNENAYKNKTNDTFKNNIKERKEETLPKKYKEAIKKNSEHENQKHSAKGMKHGKNKSKQPKKIKITINITYNNVHSKTNMKSTDTNDGDLSFLDDFDVDEVVESLFNSKDQNKSIIKTNIEEKISPKKRKTPNTEQTSPMKKESCLKHISRDDNETEVTKKPNVEKEKSQDEATENNTRDSERHIKTSPNNLDNNSKNSIISTKQDNDSKEHKNISLVEVDHNMNKKTNISQSILNKFVTKADKDLASNLEIKMFDNLKEKYSVLAVTHYGKFSKIFKCIDTYGDYYAVKILDNPATNHLKGKKKENILLELKKDIPEENLRCINLLHCFQIDKHICYMTSYYPNNLEQLLTEKKFNIEEIQLLAKQLVEAVTILRSKNIVHHDIKPSHILLDYKTEKLTLCGFDEAVLYVPSDNLKNNIGTVNYASPEKILHHSYGFPVDVWSTALVIYEMATNTMLFPGTTDNEILFKQMSMLGNIPENIIKDSRFKNVHFRGTTFIKKGLNQYSDVRINNFVKNNNIYASILAAQSAHQSHNGHEKKNIEIKLQSLIRLLGKMLILDPRKRLTIEYVYADNFFFDKEKIIQ